MVRLALVLTAFWAFECRDLSGQEKFPLPNTTLLDIQDEEPISSEGGRIIALEVMFADIPATKGQPAVEAAPQPPAGEVSTADEVWLRRLKNPDEKTKGHISTIRLTAIENESAMVQFGQETPVVTGVNRGRGAERSSIVRQTATGTIVQCTARVLKDNSILAELEIERSRLAPESGVLLDESDDRDALRTPEQLMTTCKTTVKLKPGKPRVISGLNSKAAAGSSLNLIVVSAEILSLDE